MRNISNKRQACKELFEWSDFKKLNRICSLEIFATIIFSLEGTTEILGQNIMPFFGFQSETEFYRGELHFFFDCLFRGLCNLTVRKEDSFPQHRSFYVSQAEIKKIVDGIFPDNKESVDRQQFLSTFIKHSVMQDLISIFNTKFKEFLTYLKQRELERTRIRGLLRILFVDMQKKAIAIGEENARKRAAGEMPPR